MKKNLKLNLGCGYDYRPGWINIDAVAKTHPDLVHDLNRPLPFETGSVTKVVAQDILEHFTYEDVDLVIGEIARVLRTRGQLHIRVPNTDRIISQFRKSPWVRNHFLYGDTADSGAFGSHKMGFTPQVLLVKMMKHGLHPIELKIVTTNFEATFVRQNKPQKFVHAFLPSTHFSLRNFFTLLKKIRYSHVVVLENFSTKITFSLIAYFLQVPVVWLEQSSLTNEFHRYFRLPKILYRLVKDIPTLVVLPNKKIQNEFLTNTRIDLTKIRIVDEKTLAEIWNNLLREAIVTHQAQRWLRKHF